VRPTAHSSRASTNGCRLNITRRFPDLRAPRIRAFRLRTESACEFAWDPPRATSARGADFGVSGYSICSSGCLRRKTLWQASDGGSVEVTATRLIPLNGGPLLAIRLSIRSIDYSGPVLLESCIEASDAAIRADDPRIGAGLGAALVVGERRIEGASAVMTQSAPRSGIQVAIAQAHRRDQ
jgi:hypothetical protein